MNTLEIDDLNCASYVATKTRLLSTRQDGTRTKFTFDNTGNIAGESALAFVNGPDVNLRAYLAAFRELRSISYAARKAAQ